MPRVIAKIISEWSRWRRFGGLIEEALESSAEALGEFLGRSRDEVPKLVRFEPEPQPLDRIEIRRVTGQELRFEMMPVDARRVVPRTCS